MFALCHLLKTQRRSVPVKRSLNNRLAYVDALVDANALVIESIWLSATPNYTTKAAVVPLRTFIQEVLKRSRTTYSTLQTALFYLFRSRPEILKHLQRMQATRISGNERWEDAYISCGRRMFLASLVLASKFVQDKTYRNSAWAKIAGLPVSEVNAAERIFLNLIDYRLYISQPTFEQWHHMLHMHVEAKTHNLPSTLQDLSRLPFNPNASSHPPIYPTQQQTLSATGWPTFGQNILPKPCEYQETLSRKRRHHQQEYSILSPPLSCNSTSPTHPLPPVLSMSLPSSSHSSPMHTPTQISPVRITNSGSFFNWKLMPSPSSHHDHNTTKIYHPTFVNYEESVHKKRRMTLDDHYCPRPVMKRKQSTPQ
ncbi:hypothetical protein K501DRAFT_234377 [Backusella circina FSU 941]|nr:hypothetical protein K501DRAFT_234377 [Backusella circina FSU 941]